MKRLRLFILVSTIAIVVAVGGALATSHGTQTSGSEPGTATTGGSGATVPAPMLAADVPPSQPEATAPSASSMTMATGTAGTAGRVTESPFGQAAHELVNLCERWRATLIVAAMKSEDVAVQIAGSRAIQLGPHSAWRLTGHRRAVATRGEGSRVVH